MKAAAVTIEGSQSDRGRDFPPVELAQFGQFGQQRDDGHVSDAGSAAQQGGFFGEHVVRFDEHGDLGFDLLDLFVRSLVNSSHFSSEGKKDSQVSLGTSMPTTVFGESFMETSLSGEYELASALGRRRLRRLSGLLPKD